MPTSQKKAPSKRSSAVRDITVKKITKDAFDDDFRVHHIHDAQADLPSVEPLISVGALNNEKQSVEDEVADAFAEIAEEPQQKEYQSPQEVEPRDYVKVRFAKFVQLVSTRDCSDVVNANPDEEVVISSNLLTELAGAHDEREEKKIPLVFLVGLAIGVVLTYILIMK